ncbi:hypothetical protein HK096_009157, partial [Nowakowskiella sp. JEL0078]
MPEVLTESNENTENVQLETMKVKESAAEFWQPQQDQRSDNLRSFHNIVESPYTLPADLEERDRLEAQHIVTTNSFGGHFRMPIKEILSTKGSKILDVGCGPGSWTRDVAKEYPLCDVHCVDMVKTLYPEVEKLPNTYFVLANIMDGLPFPDNHFDAVFQRYLILAIPKDKWDFLISELVRVTKPGGYVECLEVNSKFEQLGPIGDKLWDGVAKAFILRGLDLDIYWNLPEKFKRAGLEFESETPASLPIGWSGVAGNIHLKNVKMLIEALKPFLLGVFEMNDEDFSAMNDEAVEEYPKYKSFWNCIAVVGKKP